MNVFSWLPHLWVRSEIMDAYVCLEPRCNVWVRSEELARKGWRRRPTNKMLNRLAEQRWPVVV